MIDDEEMEEFELNEEDLQRAYNPGYKRHKMTKEEAMLGIWASREYSDSEEEDNFSFRRQQKYSKSGVDFVASKSSKKSELEKDQKAKDNISDEEELKDFIQNESLLAESESDNDNMEELNTKNYYQIKQPIVAQNFKPTTQKQVPKITKYFFLQIFTN